MNFFLDSDYNFKDHEVSSKWKLIFIWLFILFIFSFLLKSLFDLQIIHGEENLIQARNISQTQDIIRASRGVIYDINGNILAKNKPAYSVYVNIEEFKQSENSDLIFDKLSAILNIDENQLKQTYEFKLKDVVGSEVQLFNDISYDQYLQILIKKNELPGILAFEEPIREYPYSYYTSHILGYVGSVNNEEVDEFNLDNNAKIGKEGVERVYDDRLRGQDGTLVKTFISTTDKKQEFVSQYAIDGNNLILSLDINWQKKLYDLLQNQINTTGAFAGVAIVMETKTGNIKAMVNVPSYDDNLFSKGISSTDYANLINDDHTPLLNRAIALQLPVGSIFKPMVAATALQEQVITPQTQFKSGCVELPLYKLCEADHVYLGTMTVVEGLGRSSNVFFCKTALALTEKANGIRTLINYTDQFGIGKLTGIDLPGEQPGTMASPELKLERQKEPWYLADICNTAIGQGLVTATPIQMVSVAQIIGNNGDFYKPNLVKEIQDQSGNTVYSYEPKLIRHVNVDERYFEIIKKGMRYSINGNRGSAWLLRGVQGDPYAKTGSADAVEYRNGKKVEGAHSWVMGGFSYNGVDYNFVVHLQEGGRGYKSVPVIRDFINWLYSN